MKNVTAFIGSPRRNGNTEFLTDKLLEGIQSQGINIEKVYLPDYQIFGCRGCLSCMKNNRCILEDDMSMLYSKMEQSDGYLFASPSYNYNVTAYMKAFIDRLFCYYRFSKSDEWKSLLGDNKKAIVAGVCGGAGEENMGYTVQGMKRPLEDLEIKVIKEITYYNSKRIPVSKNVDFQKELVSIGADFGQMF